MPALTPAQRARRIRVKHARLDALTAEAKAIAAELSILEREHALSLGMPTLRGKQLLAAMDREQGLAGRRAG